MPALQPCPVWHGAHVAAAVDVGLGAVLDGIGTRRRDAEAGGADDALAIGGRVASFARSTGCAVGAAAIDVGFGAVLDGVVASGGRHTPAEQTPLWQSEPAVQDLPVAQGAQLGPPQSTSVSAPFLTASLQAGAVQIPAEQILLWQSEKAVHALPPAHGAQLGPPQSTSVSVPFLTASLQAGAVQTPPEQTSL